MTRLIFSPARYVPKCSRSSGWERPVVICLCLLVGAFSGLWSPVEIWAAQDDSVDAKSTAERDLAALFASSLQSVTGTESWPCIYSGHFLQRRSLAGSSTTLKSSGQFFYSCEQGLLWETHKPILESMVYTQSGKHFRVRGDAQVKVLDGIVQSRVGTLLLNLLGGNTDELSADFSVRQDPSDASTLNLLPNKKSLKQYLQLITLRSRPGEMTVSLQTANSGDTSLIINQFQQHEKVPVVACAAISQLADQACQRLFAPATADD